MAATIINSRGHYPVIWISGTFKFKLGLNSILMPFIEIFVSTLDELADRSGNLFLLH